MNVDSGFLWSRLNKERILNMFFEIHNPILVNAIRNFFFCVCALVLRMKMFYFFMITNLLYGE